MARTKEISLVTFYQLLLVVKFLAVMGFAGGILTVFLSESVASKKRAAHQVASPCLLLTWLCGYALALVAGFPLFELWIVGALLLSTVANAVLSYSVARTVHPVKTFSWIAASLVGVVVLMVVKPTWNLVLG